MLFLKVNTVWLRWQYWCCTCVLGCCELWRCWALRRLFANLVRCFIQNLFVLFNNICFFLSFSPPEDFVRPLGSVCRAAGGACDGTQQTACFLMWSVFISSKFSLFNKNYLLTQLLKCAMAFHRNVRSTWARPTAPPVNHHVTNNFKLNFFYLSHSLTHSLSQYRNVTPAVCAWIASARANRCVLVLAQQAATTRTHALRRNVSATSACTRRWLAQRVTTPTSALWVICARSTVIALV